MMNKLNMKHLKKASAELMPATWHPTRWWDWCLSKDEKKGIENMLLIKLGSLKGKLVEGVKMLSPL